MAVDAITAAAMSKATAPVLLRHNPALVLALALEVCVAGIVAVKAAAQGGVVGGWGAGCRCCWCWCWWHVRETPGEARRRRRRRGVLGAEVEL